MRTLMIGLAAVLAASCSKSDGDKPAPAPAPAPIPAPVPAPAPAPPPAAATIEATANELYKRLSEGKGADDEGGVFLSADKKWAIVVIDQGCGDMCHQTAHVVGTGVDLELEGNHPEGIVWSPDGTEVALFFEEEEMVGDGEIKSTGFSTSVIKLGSPPTVTKFAGTSAPAFAADGTLTVKSKKGGAMKRGPDGKLVKA